MTSMVEFDDDRLLDEFMNRLYVWNPEDWEYKLFETYYGNMITRGDFCNINFDDIMTIVDNDWVNNFNCYTSYDIGVNDLYNFDGSKILIELDSGEILYDKR